MRSRMLLMLLGFMDLMLIGFQLLSSFTSAFALTATVDIEPDTLNVNMKGEWITAHIALEGHSASDIDPATILLEGLFEAERSRIEGKVLIVKFDASAVTSYLLDRLYHMGVSNAQIELTINGQLTNGTNFTGSDAITVIFTPIH